MHICKILSKVHGTCIPAFCALSESAKCMYTFRCSITIVTESSPELFTNRAVTYMYRYVVHVP